MDGEFGEAGGGGTVCRQVDDALHVGQGEDESGLGTVESSAGGIDKTSVGGEKRLPRKDREQLGNCQGGSR